MKKRLDEFVKAFITATELTLLEQCKVKIESTNQYPGTFAGAAASSVAGIIGITSSEIQGSMCAQFPTDTFLQLMNGMLGENMTTLEPGMEDGATELVNIIFGNAKATLNDAGFGIQMALPTLLKGKTISNVGGSSPQNTILIEFTTSIGSFWISFELNEKKTDIQPPAGNQPLQKNWSADVLLEFVKAVRKTMQVQFETPIEIGAPFKKSSSQGFMFDVGSIIGVTDQDFTGYFGMYYEGAAFLGLMEKLLGMEFKELNEEIQDGAGEITNICFGVAKNVLNQQGHAIQMALPTLIRGKDIESGSSQINRNTIAVPLKTPHGQFWIEFGYKEKSHS
jgi:CheY-specific phosphatase CheX